MATNGLAFSIFGKKIQKEDWLEYIYNFKVVEGVPNFVKRCIPAEIYNLLVIVHFFNFYFLCIDTV
jgi:hypothetical protein